MKRECAIVLAVFAVVPCITSAQELGVKRLPADLPETYEVRRGDTLWDISKRFFGDPFSWPDIWKKNEFIRDPHWIYPGQTINFGQFRTHTEAPVPSTPSETAPTRTPAPEAPAAVKQMSEPAPFTQTTAAAPMPAPAPIPADPNVIRLLDTPQPVFTEKNFMRTGFIAKRSGLSKKKVTRVEGEQVSAVRYDAVEVNMGEADGLKKGDLLAVFAIGDRVKHPDTGFDYGYVVRVKGVLRVESLGRNQARCTVSANLDPLAVDDPVMRYEIKRGPDFDAWVRPDMKIAATVLAINEPMISIHTNDILYIDKGAENGVRPGDHFAVYPRKAGDTGYRSLLGELEAISVMPKETAVIVLSLKGEKIEIGDRVELSARCRLVKK